MFKSPEVKSAWGIYEYAWADYGLVIRLDHLRDHHDTLYAELTILVGNSEVSTVYVDKVNLLSGRTRLQTAKVIEEEADDKLKVLPWADMLKYCYLDCIRQFRKGEPIVLLDTSKADITPPVYILKPFLLEELPTIIFGDRGSLKSQFALLLCQMAEWPQACENSLGLTLPEEKHKVVYLDWETGEKTTLWQLRRLQEGMNFPHITMSYRRCRRPLAQDIAEITKYLLPLNASILIIDSLGPACGGNLNETQPALEFFSALASIKMTALILAHTAKNPETKRRSTFGSSFFENEARNIFEAQASQEPGSDIAYLGLYHRKPPPFHGYTPSLCFKFEFSPTAATVSREDIADIPDLAEKVSMKARLTNVMKRAGRLLTISELLNEMGLDEEKHASVKAALNKEKGHIFYCELHPGQESLWGLLTNE